MKRLLLLLLCPFMACPKPPPPKPPDDQFIVTEPKAVNKDDASALSGEAKQKMKDGTSAFESGDYEKAAALFEEANKLSPKNASVCFNLGLTYQALGKLDAAVAIFEEATKRKPDFAEAYNGWGSMLIELDQADKGITALQKALELQPKYFEAQYNLGEAYRAKGDLNQAKESYLKAAKLSPSDADTHASIGGILLVQKEYQGAKEYLGKAVELSQQDPQIVLLYGQALDEGGDTAGAEKAYLSSISKAEKLATTDDFYKSVASQGYYTLGNMRLEKNDLVGAEDAMKKWVALSPKSAAAYGSLCIVQIKAKKNKEAETSCLKALELKPGALSPGLSLGELYLDQKKCADAKKYLTPALPKVDDKDKKAELEKRLSTCK
jgi:superkiller protein 3